MTELLTLAAIGLALRALAIVLARSGFPWCFAAFAIMTVLVYVLPEAPSPGDYGS